MKPLRKIVGVFLRLAWAIGAASARHWFGGTDQGHGKRRSPAPL